ncbi:MAG: hypothetical protein AB1349_11175 [Elusimicrobiota bacterium]
MAVLKNILKSENAASDTEYSLLILLLLASVLALRVFSSILNAIFLKAAGRITKAV